MKEKFLLDKSDDKINYSVNKEFEIKFNDSLDDTTISTS